MQPYSVAELYAGLSETHLSAAPGRVWSYSNLGYALLGHVIERATRRPFEESLRREFLAPLGMDHSAAWGSSVELLTGGRTSLGPPRRERPLARAPSP